MSKVSSDMDKKKPEDMPTDPSILYGRWLTNVPPGEEIMITGLAALLPESNDIYHFRDNLYNKIDMVTDNDRRWSITHPEIPKRSGKIFNADKFDAGYFGVHQRQAHCMDPMVRLLLEKSIEAILDAGYHPSELEGTNTGVYVAACFSESEKTWYFDQLSPDYPAITGCTRSMISHRISYHLKLQGPSHNVDTACSSSNYALEQAYKDIRNGKCDRAIVGGTNLCLHPFVTLQFARLGVLSREGACKVFDVNGDGYVRSESAGVIFLQKGNESRRVYATILHAKTNCDGYKPQSITFPSQEMQRTLLDEFYQECKDKATDLTYLEAHGTATIVGDPEEAAAVDEVFCKKRGRPLLVGSVKSNLGHSEGSSGLNSIIKVVLSMENEIIPPNLHYTKVRPGVEALESGRLKVVTKTTPLPDDRGLIGINSFGFGGSNCHILLRWNHNKKINHGLPDDDIPRLVCVSGRTGDSVPKILDDLAGRKLDKEYVRLYHQIFSKEMIGFSYRGYSILTKNGEIRRASGRRPATKHPLYLVFSNFGSDWFNVAKDFCKIPIFTASIEKIHQLLTKKNVNILSILQNGSKDDTDSIFNQIMGNLCLQIALIDVVRALKLEPEGVIGLGLSEFLCGYFDGSLTLEETVMCVYQIAQSVYYVNNDSVSYAIGVTGDKLGRLPPNVNVTEIRKDGVTITGSANSFDKFINNLKQQGIAATKIDNITDFQHNNFITIKTQIQQAVSKHISKPKARSAKWLSLSTNQLASSDFFLEAINSVDSLAKIVEGLDRKTAIVEIGNGQLKITENGKKLMSFANQKSGSLLVMLEILGSLYKSGHNMDLAKLYPDVSYPVSRGTPMISPLIEWDHSWSWPVLRYKQKVTMKSGEKITEVTPQDEEWTYITGHVIEGRNLFPAIAYLVLVWEAFALKLGTITADMQVVFENCKFLRATTVSKERKLELIVMIQTGSGTFEVIENDSAVVTGRIYVPKQLQQEQIDLPIPTPSKNIDSLPLKTKDVYKELRLRGYNYSGEFKKIQEYHLDGSTGTIRWDSNWVTFIDNMLQLKILQLDSRLLYVPVNIQRLSIDFKGHVTYAQSIGEENPNLPVYLYDDLDIIKCGGIEVRGLKASSIAKKRQTEEPVLEKYVFVPNEAQLPIHEAIRTIIQIMVENSPSIKVKVVEVIEETTSEPLAPLIHEVLSDLPLMQPDVTILTKEPLTFPNVKTENRKLAAESDCSLVTLSNALNNTVLLVQAMRALKDNGYILSREDLNFEPSQVTIPDIDILTIYTIDKKERLVLIRKNLTKLDQRTVIDVSDSDTFTWLPTLQNSLSNGEKIIVYAQDKPQSGILGLVNCIRREPGGNSVQCVFICDKAPPFSLSNPLYKEQLRKNLAINVLKGLKWGTYRHLLLDEEKVECEHCYVNVTVRGDLSSLKWIEGPLKYNMPLPPEKLLVQAYYCALNFRDVMTASGRINSDIITMDRTQQECVQGFEFSGRTMSGKRVMGMVTSGALANLITADTYMVYPIPDQWSMEDAATVPVVFGTILYALFIRTSIKPGDSILIHSGSGGVGQATISLCLHYGCEVFTTVGTNEKREFLKNKFPKLTDDHIGNSRDTSFEDMIYCQTEGRGVDFVLNSLAEEKLQASVRCLAKGGRFLEIGKFDLAADNQLQLQFLEKEASFHGIMLDQIFASGPDIKLAIGKLMLSLLNKGVIQPLTRTVFQEDEVVEAFRFMTSGKHIGKVLIKIRSEESEKIIDPIFKTVKVIPRYYCNPDHVCVIIGGLGGFGLELADWLVLRGARKLVLTSRSGVQTGYQFLRIKTWKSYGATVLVSTADVTTREGCEQLLEEANTLGTVESIFNLAVVLVDAIIENQTEAKFRTSLAPKAYATTYLDEISRTKCPSLKDFVVFSSVSCGRGNGGQSNYGMANSVMERICEKRRDEGYPALAVEWGAVGDVGIVAEMQENDTVLEIGGTLQQRITSCLQVLDVLMRQLNPVVSSMVVAKKRGAAGLATNLDEVVAQILGIKDLKTISLHSPLSELGMDSMTAVEIKQTLEREFQVFLSPQEIRAMTFARLLEIQDELASADENVVKAIEKPVKGFDMLIRRIIDEDIINVPTLKLPTKLPEEAAAPQVLFFPGIEGVAITLEPLSKNMNLNAVCVQTIFNNPKDTIQETAESILPTVIPLIKKSEPFHFVAYSFGSLIALELTRLLEKQGYRGKLICVDGAPELMCELLKSQLDLGTEAQFQTGFLSQIMSFHLPAETILKYQDKMVACKNFEQRLVTAEEVIIKESPHSPRYMKQVSLALYKRLNALKDYNPKFKIKSSVKLFKPTGLSLPGLKEDYGLCELCENPVDVKVFQGNHVTLLENVEMADEINVWAGAAGVEK